MTYIDTHVAIWLYFGEIDFISQAARKYMEKREIFISPIALLELKYLKEVEKLSVAPVKMVEILRHDVGLQICQKSFQEVMEESLKHSWTRDPFDRVITAQASLNKQILITRDQTIQAHYKYALW